MRLELLDASERQLVSIALLTRSAPLVAGALGIPCDLILIQCGRNAEEQVGILGEIAKAVKQERVTIDITHGFRHLAALGLLSAFFLEKVARLQVDDLYYGALDMTENDITPVVYLNGRLQVQRWIDALDRFDQDGNYGVFTPLIQADAVPEDKARCLTNAAAFHELTFHLVDSRRTTAEQCSGGSVVVVQEPPFLRAVHRSIGGVKAKDQFLEGRATNRSTNTA